MPLLGSAITARVLHCFVTPQVYRKKWVIHIERITREKVNGEAHCCTLMLAVGGGGCRMAVARS